MIVGVLVNPIAGIGGESGFKGSDHHWKEALAQGFTSPAPERAARLVAAVGSEVEWCSVQGPLGVPGTRRIPFQSDAETTAEDSKRAAIALCDAGIDVLCFVGGDGTATDIAHANPSVPCLGIPGGVKITSPVFAYDVDDAVEFLLHLGRGFETTMRDVTDVDEEAYREGRLETKLTGQLRVPLTPIVQGSKCATTADTPLEPLVDEVMEHWDPDALYVVGAGSVTKAIKDQFWGEPTLLGVDVIHTNRIQHSDCNGPRLRELLANWSGPVKILLSTIGGQGMLLGRGTQVLNPILQQVGWDHIWVVAPPEKLIGQPGLHVDCDPAFARLAPKYLRVTSGWRETRMVRVLAHQS
ncbi:MAG: ATP-NAD kinase family protein [Thermoplasmatota archaeon]